jgi:uncharacterized protein (DUF58 family)
VKIKRVVFIIPLITLAFALAGGSVWLWRLFVCLAVILLLNYIWLRLSENALSAHTSQPPGLCRAGESLDEDFTVSSHSRIPSPLIEVKEDTDLPGYQNEVAFNLPARGAQSWRTRPVCRRRGQYTVGSLTVKMTDPLGLFSLEKTMGEIHEVIVYPETLELPYFQALPSQESGKSPRRWLASEAGPSAARVRDYTSGDSYHHIHWPTTAHSGKLMVRDFEPDRSSYTFRSIWIIPDMNRAVRLGEGDESTEEYSITIAASLAKKHIESGKHVGLLAAGSRSYLCLPETGSHHLHEILLYLATMKADGQVPIEALITSQMERFEAGSVILVILPSDNQKIIGPLRQARNRGVIVTVVLLDSSSFGGETGTENTARSLAANGMYVYVMRCGSEITRALDSRLHYLQV